MPLLQQAAATLEPISNATTQEKILPAAAETTILGINAARKGHLVKNIGTTKVNVTYGVINTDNTKVEVLIQPLNPGDSYLFDRAAIIPYTAVSPVGAGNLRIVEMF